MEATRPSAEDLAAEIIALRERIRELEEAQAESRQLQREMARERKFSEMVLDSLPDAIYVVDPVNYKVMDCNQVFLDHLGLKRDKVIGHTCYQLTRRRPEPCQERKDACHAIEALKSGRPTVSEHVQTAPDGSERYIECTALPVIGSSGEVARVVHVHRDITRRQRAWHRFQKVNRELIRSNSFLRNLIKSSVDAVIAADMTGRVILFNEAAGDITGYSEREALKELDIRDIYPGDGAREIMALLRDKEHGGEGKLKSHEVRLLRKDGSTAPISLSAAVVTEDDNEVATVGFFYDLRAKQRMERELDHTRMQLLQSEKMASIGKLAAGVAHQLNNPLAGITLYANLVAEEYKLPDDARDDLKRILDNAQRCRDTIKELLQFARQTKRVMRPADLNQALTRTMFLLENQSQFQNIDVRMDLDAELPQVPADIQQLNHVFMNIILNAAEAMQGNGSIKVRTRRFPGGRGVLVEIKDTGPGIPPDVLPHVFEPFFTTKEEGEGTGLGLSVAFGIVKNHHGSIEVFSPRGQGTQFVIKLPSITAA
ncbi:MAG: PAS domain S-box protein [Desulfarculaceae bacterium]|nr:PAS domain S-box protein [Desulfarculaceae bacterium]MCF8071706.1 PAS domain S-box protein [Desulfarculaceae bacterium]MCF8102447.1 PAS domain S-box protein [Desulfarculaceae bacterium]MCF8116789.1 PAS domain S-box protein [Desulfarculaceae bacterium]